VQFISTTLERYIIYLGVQAMRAVTYALSDDPVFREAGALILRHLARPFHQDH
jgi:hypothetical protein